MGPITLYLKCVAARRAYSAAQRKDLEAWQAFQAGEREAVLVAFPNGHRMGHYCDVTQLAVNAAWRKLREANDAREAYLEDL